MKEQELRKQIAHLEFANDQLASELSYVDNLLKTIGFEKGLESVKLAAHEILQEQHQEEE
ncbi:MAG: hypothetical protein ACQEP8_01140 [Chlamydiota bacterium]